MCTYYIHRGDFWKWLSHGILEASVLIQQITSEWPASEDGQLHDPIQYMSCPMASVFIY